MLLNASIIGAAAVTLGTSYAFGDFFGAHHSLHRTFFQAKGFYTSFAGLVAVAAAIVLIPHAPLGLITVGVQALAGVLLPSAAVFLLLLCNDTAVLGPWVNRLWLNAVTTLIIGVLLVMSLILVVTTAVPRIDVTVAGPGPGRPPVRLPWGRRASCSSGAGPGGWRLRPPCRAPTGRAGACRPWPC